MSDLRAKKNTRYWVFIGLFLLAGAILVSAALAIPSLERLNAPSARVGQVAPQDFLADQALSYPSQILTEQKREAAAQAVSPVYTRPDTSIARKQLEELQSAAAFISSVRADRFATQEQQLEDLAALESIHLNRDTALALVALPEPAWQAVQQEAIAVLERVMRNTIRNDQLEEARSSVPALVSLSLPVDQAELVADLAAALIAPNSFYSEELTNAARQSARQTVQPIVRTFVAGERVVSRGQVLSEADLEALQNLGLVKPGRRWPDLVSIVLLAGLSVSFLVLYLRRLPFSQNLRSVSLLSLLFLIFLVGARLVIPGHAIIPYAFPLATYSLIVAALFGMKTAIITSFPLAILVAFGMPNETELTVYYALSCSMGVLALGGAKRLISFLYAGLAAGLSGMVVILVYRLPLPSTDWIGLSTLSGAAIFYGLASASLAVLLQFFLAQYLGITTPMQLTELTRPDQPLLQLLLRQAPGTYQHSLQVANLAEQAAESIGADPLITRVGALYHDVGKALNPLFFIENQLPGFSNPHEDLDPTASAAIIIRHVTEGIELAHKHRLPQRVVDFIAQHHGTLQARYQYARAVEAAGGDESKVDQRAFRYPGPRPQTREVAILMLADGCEARVRAERPSNEEELLRVLKISIESRVTSGQLDQTELTFRDLERIALSFQSTLRGVYHPRLVYPSMEKPPETLLPATADVPTATRGSADASPAASIDQAQGTP